MHVDWTTDPPSNPLSGTGRLGRLAPFAAVIGGTGVIYFVLAGDSLAGWEIVALAAVLLGMVGAITMVSWQRLPRWPQMVVPVLGIALVVLLQVFAQPADVDLGALLLLPVLWSALYSSMRDTLVIAGLAIACCVGLQGWEEVTGRPVGFTGWTEVAALAFTAAMMAAFIASARQHARTDLLTGVANRRAWDELLEAEIGRSRMHHADVLVAMIDLDDFKAYNDAHGHAGGDDHLKGCARAWGAEMRHSDVLARVGGEEFAVLLRDAGEEDAQRVLHRLARATPNSQTCSIGLATWDGREDAGHLMLRADEALYEAKETGRDRLVVAPPPARGRGVVSALAQAGSSTLLPPGGGAAPTRG